MSLINDALKRASQTEKARPRESAPPPAMLAVSAPHRSIVPTVIVVSVVVLLAVAGALVWHSFSRSPTQVQSANPAPSVTHQAAPAPTPKTEPAAVPTPAPQPVVVTPPPDPTPATPPPQPAVATPPSQPVEPFPDVKLQGIFYNAKNPRATINGQIKREHEQVGDITVVKITQTSVTVQWNGQTKDLYLNGQ